MKAKSALSLALAAGFAGTAMASNNTPTTLTPTTGNVIKAAHIYYNIATGERVITVLGDGQTAAADNGVSGPIWSSRVVNPCAGIDNGAGGTYTTTYFFGLDNNSTPTPYSLNTDATSIDFGDIAVDTVVDCVHLDWVTAHPDTDTDTDGIGDGVVGLGGEWTYWDADNGREADRSTRTALINFILIDLPGNVFGDGFLTGYTADIDLAASFTGTSLTFEIGTTDHDSQGAAFFNDMGEDQQNPGTFGPIATLDNNFDSLPDSDLDGDTLFDWAWGVRFSQPGTRDLDGDGNLDGDIADSFQTIGMSFGVGAGTAVDNMDGTWTWDLNTTDIDAANGQEDVFALYLPPNNDDDILYGGLFFFGGYACEGGPIVAGDPDSGYTPFSAFEHQLFGPGGPGPCRADLDGSMSLNFFDISAFLSLFSAGDLLADFDDSGSLNFFDISEFLTQFSAGCVFE